MEFDIVMPWFIEWLWIPLWVAVIELFRRVFTFRKESDDRHAESDKRLSLLERENRVREETTRQVLHSISSTNETVQRHHNSMMTELGKTNAAIARVEGKVSRNGSK